MVHPLRVCRSSVCLSTHYCQSPTHFMLIEKILEECTTKCSACSQCVSGGTKRFLIVLCFQFLPCLFVNTAAKMISPTFSLFLGCMRWSLSQSSIPTSVFIRASFTAQGSEPACPKPGPSPAGLVPVQTPLRLLLPTTGTSLKETRPQNSTVYVFLSKKQ